MAVQTNTALILYKNKTQSSSNLTGEITQDIPESDEDASNPYKNATKNPEGQVNPQKNKAKEPFIVKIDKSASCPEKNSPDQISEPCNGERLLTPTKYRQDKRGIRN